MTIDKKLLGTGYTLIGKYVNREIPVKLRHEICGTEIETSFCSFLKGYGICRTCFPKGNNGHHNRKSNYLENILSTRSDGNEYKWIGKYEGSNKIKIEILHEICGFSYLVRPNDFQQGSTCPVCKLKHSPRLKFIMDFLLENKINFQLEKMIDGWKYDICITDHSIIIEFDGEQHFRKNTDPSEKTNKWLNGNTQKNDIIKNNNILKSDEYSLVRIKYCASIKEINDFLIYLFLNENHKCSLKSDRFLFIDKGLPLINFKDYYQELYGCR